EGADKLCMSLNPQCAPSTTSTLTPDDPTDDMAVWGDQDRLISQIADANRHTVVVLQTGAPVLTPWRGQVAAILEAWYPGETGGAAAAGLLYGAAAPGGRLPATFPAREAEEPTAGDTATYPGVPAPTQDSDSGFAAIFDETYKEGVFVGYRWFDEHRLRPA